RSEWLFLKPSPASVDRQDVELRAKNQEPNIWPRVSIGLSPGSLSTSVRGPGTAAVSLPLRPVTQVWTQYLKRRQTCATEHRDGRRRWGAERDCVQQDRGGQKSSVQSQALSLSTMPA